MEKDTIIQHFQQLYEIIQKARTAALHWTLVSSGLSIVGSVKPQLPEMHHGWVKSHGHIII